MNEIIDNLKLADETSQRQQANKISDKDSLLGVIFAICAGFLADKVIFSGLTGIGFSLLMCNFILLYLFMLKSKLKLTGNKGLLWIIPILIIAFRSTFYDNMPIQGLNVLVLPILMTGAAIIIWCPHIQFDKAIFLLEIWSHIILFPLINCGKIFTSIKRLIPSKKRQNSIKLNPHIAMGLLFSIPLLFIVIVFLSSADMMFNYYVMEFFDALDISRYLKISDITIIHLIIITFISIYSFAFVWSFVERKASAPYNDGTKLEVEALTISIPVALINIIYLLFSIVQFSYLYGGGSLPSGFTYAEYARKGFFELVAVTVINFSIILIGVNRTKTSSKKMGIFCNILYSLLIVFTLSMLYSANYKMRLYENTYGYTYLRVYVHLFMILLLILNLGAMCALWYKKINLYKSALIITIIFYSTVNLFNVDGYIAKENIEIYRINGKIDAQYLTNLSNDALPYLVELSTDSNENVRQIIKQDLDLRCQRLNDAQNNTSILQFSFSRHRAKKLLN